MINLDRQFYLVIETWKDGEFFFAEETAMQLSLEVLITQLSDGQFHKPQCVIEFNPVEGWSRDISEDVAEKWWSKISGDFDPKADAVPEFIDEHIGSSEMDYHLEQLAKDRDAEREKHERKS